MLEDLGQEKLQALPGTPVCVRVINGSHIRVVSRRICKGMLGIAVGVNLPVSPHRREFVRQRQNLIRDLLTLLKPGRKAVPNYRRLRRV